MGLYISVYYNDINVLKLETIPLIIGLCLGKNERSSDLTTI